MPAKPPQRPDTTSTPPDTDYISEYRKRFGHRVPLVATRQPHWEEELKAALDNNEPIKEFAEWPHRMQGDYMVDQES